MRVIENDFTQGGPPKGLAFDFPEGTRDLREFSHWFRQFESVSKTEIANILTQEFTAKETIVEAFAMTLFQRFDSCGFYRLDISDAPRDDRPEWIAFQSKMGTILVREPDKWQPPDDVLSSYPVLCDLLGHFGRLAFTRDGFFSSSVLPDQGFYRPPDTLTEESMAFTAHRDEILLGSSFFYRTPCNNYFGIANNGNILKWWYEDGETEVVFKSLSEFLESLIDFWSQNSVNSDNPFYY